MQRLDASFLQTHTASLIQTDGKNEFQTMPKHLQDLKMQLHIIKLTD